MNTKLLLILLFGLIHSSQGSDLRLVPTWNSSSSSEEYAHIRPVNHDRVVPHIDLSPLGVQRDSIKTDSDDESKRFEVIFYKFAYFKKCKKVMNK